MSVSNGIITAPENPKEVYELLEVAQKDGWWDVGYICSNTHGKINKWSRYKPVHIANAFGVDMDSLWYRGTDLNCGLVPVVTSSISAIVDSYDNGESDWAYYPPWGYRGGSVCSPYRLTDFEKYKHNAEAPISNFTYPGKVEEKKTFSCNIMEMIAIDNEQEYKKPGGLTLKEISISGESVGDWYKGAVVTDTSGSVMFFAAGKKLDDGTYGHGFPTFNASSLKLNSDYHIYPFLSKNPQAQGASAVANTFITMPNVLPGTFKVVSLEDLDDITISFSARYLYDENNKPSAIHGSFIVTNNGISKTFNGNSIQFKFTSSGEFDPIKAGEGSENLDDFTVPGNGGKYTKTFTFTIYSQFQDKRYYVRLSLNTNEYIKKVFPLQIALPPDIEVTV